MHITLRPNEKIYINGAVLRVDRKVSVELMNDAVFLLEAHVMLERNATTPLRKLYFIVQLMLIEPQDLAPKKMMFNLQGLTVSGAYQDASMQAGLSAVTELVQRGRAFEALKIIRSMLPTEDALIAGAAPQEVAAPPFAAAPPSPVVERVAPPRRPMPRAVHAATKLNASPVA